MRQKCAACNQRKGKRECRRVQGMICSVCCGSTRTEDACGECRYYQSSAARRNYRQLPRFPLADMDANSYLQDMAREVEGVLCWFDRRVPEFRDPAAIKILERLLDKYCFNEEPEIQDKIVAAGFESVVHHIERNIEDPHESADFRKVLAVIWFVAQRRSCGGREYLDFLRRFVGSGITPEVQVLPRTLE